MPPFPKQMYRRAASDCRRTHPGVWSRPHEGGGDVVITKAVSSAHNRIGHFCIGSAMAVAMQSLAEASQKASLDSTS